jgi:hypothetical protein
VCKSSKQARVLIGLDGWISIFFSV